MSSQSYKRDVRPEQKAGMTLIVKTVARLTFGLILIFGTYVVFEGHLSSGGGFPGGVIIALAFINLVLAFGWKPVMGKLPRRRAILIGSMGISLFLLLSLFGLISGVFFKNVIPRGEAFTLFSAGHILYCNIGICLNVGMGLFAIFLALILFRIEPEDGA